MTVPQAFATIVGASLVLVAGHMLSQHRTRRFKALFWMAVGASFLAAGSRPQVIELLGLDSIEVRVRLVVGLLSVIILAATLEAIRVSRMQERYAFLWLTAGTILFVGSISPYLTRWISAVTGMDYVPAVLVVVLAFFLLMLFHVSVALSHLQNKVSQLTQELAVSEERLRQLERPKDRGPSPERET